MKSTSDVIIIIAFIDYLFKNGFNGSKEVPEFQEWALKVKAGAISWSKRSGKAKAEWGLMPLVQMVMFSKDEKDPAFEKYILAGIQALLLFSLRNFPFKYLNYLNFFDNI